MADKINTTTIIIEQKTGTWKYARDLLKKLEEKTDSEQLKKLCRNPNCRYYLFEWLEENNKITNHTLEKNASVCIPKDISDYKQIISVIGVWAINRNPIFISYESIKFKNCIIFQHKQQPGLDKEDSAKIISELVKNEQTYSKEKLAEYIKTYINKNEDCAITDITAEDIRSGDITPEEIVELYPKSEPIFRKYFELKKETSNSDDKTISQAIGAQHHEFYKIVDDAKKNMEKLLKRASKEEWRDLALVFFNRFCSNNDSDFIGEAADEKKENKKNSYLMYKLFVEHKKTQTFIEKFKERLVKYIKKYSYDIVSFRLYDFHKSIYGTGEEPEGISRPVFGNFSMAAIKNDIKNIFEFSDAKNGPAICFHDIQGFNVEAKEIQIKNGKFTCKLVFDFYDHFGLDLKDMETHGASGFPEWYILQHLKEDGVQTGCKAFVNHIKHEEPLELEIEN